MAHLTSFFFLAAIIALTCAVPYFPRPNSAKARSSGFSISWSPGEQERARSSGFTTGFLPREQALLQRVTDSLANNEKDLLWTLYNNLNDDQRALLQDITISWKAQKKAFMQDLLDELSEEEKAALQRFTISIGGKQERAEKQAQWPGTNELYRRMGRLGLPASDEAKAERDVHYPTYIIRNPGEVEANAEGLSPTDILGLVGDLSNSVADRINNNKDAGRAPLGPTDFLKLASDLADKVSTRLNNNGGSQAKEQDFTIGDAARVIGAVAPFVLGK